MIRPALVHFSMMNSVHGQQHVFTHESPRAKGALAFYPLGHFAFFRPLLTNNNSLKMFSFVPRTVGEQGTMIGVSPNVAHT